jgi:hypothetical protein
LVLYRINELRQQYRHYAGIVERLQYSNDPQTAGELRYYSERLTRVGEELGWLLAKQKDQEHINSQKSNNL